MAAPLAPRIVDAILLGQGDRRRQLQDFPILVDVWTLFAQRPARTHDLLLTPHRSVAASRVAEYLEPEVRDRSDDAPDRAVAHLQGLVAARLRLEELWSVVLPASSWWADVRRDWIVAGEGLQGLAEDIALLLAAEVERERSVRGGPADPHLRKREQMLEARTSGSRQIVRLGLLIGCLAAAAQLDAEDTIPTLGDLRERAGADTIAQRGEAGIALCNANYTLDLLADRLSGEERRRGLVWNVAANRQAEYAASRSVPAIKADAARQLFSIRCAEIGWAVVDSGIDSSHPAFWLDPKRGAAGGTRVLETYDFGDIRAILSRSNLFSQRIRGQLIKRLKPKLKGVDDVEERILSLARSASENRPVDWTVAEPLICRRSPEPPANPHGTHVAGILGGSWEPDDGSPGLVGVCPDIRLYDLRVLGPDAEQSEFAVIAALQFVRHLNSRNSFSTIDGVNLSLSIPHNVRNYACGRTPVCMEAEALAAAGTVVVAAAGNRGYQSFRLSDDSSFESYAASSITDPGNADAVITVGATHRYWPHTYGVSFFSSRGPTGDGRLKPDILAPGERIESCVPGPALDAMDGTSMAAPHVSGAAALLMARHRELKGRPARIKEVLCATATDLGRERSFQGSGMVDVLRAIQAL